MKLKNKILLPILSVAAIATTVPVAVLATACSKNGEQPVDPTPTPVQKTIFDIENGVLKGFKNTTTQEQLNNYVLNNKGKFILPPCTKVAAHAFDQSVATLSLNQAFALAEEISPFGTAIQIPVDTLEIDDYSFYGNSAQHVEWTGTGGIAASQLTTIGQSSFSDCTRLESFEFPPSLQTIDNSAFAGCKALVRLDFTAMAGTTQTNAFDNILKLTCCLGTDVFSNTAAGYTEQTPADIVLPSKLSDTGKTAIEVTDEHDAAVGMISANLFASYVNLNSGKRVWNWEVSVGDDTANPGYNVQILYHPIPANWLDLSTPASEGSKSVKLQRTGIIDKWYNLALDHCNTLYIPTEIYVKDTSESATSPFKTLEIDAFERTHAASPATDYYFNGLEGDTCPMYNNLWIADDGIYTIPSLLCNGNTHLQFVRLGKDKDTTHLDGVIEERAFYNCQSITRINLNEVEYQTIGEHAFARNDSITNWFGRSWKEDSESPTGYIDENANQLNELHLTSASYKTSAFDDCDKITKLYFDAAVDYTAWGSGIFANCDNINDIHFEALNFSYTTAEGVTTMGGTFKTSLMTAVGDQIIFNSALKDEGTIHMPKFIASSGASARDATLNEFANVDASITDIAAIKKAGWKDDHGYTGFYWIVTQSGTNAPAYDWTYAA